MSEGKRSRRKLRPFLAIAGFVILAAVGYFGYAVVGSHLEQSRVARTFQPVAAEVVSSALRTVSAGTGVNKPVSYRVDVQYRYTVDGREYRSRRYAFMGAGITDYAEAKRLAGKYPAGKHITAFYDPEQPAEAVLYRDPPGLPVGVMIFPFALFGLVGLIILVYGLRGRPER